MAINTTLLRSLPKVDESIKDLEPFLSENIPHAVVKTAVQECIERQRARFLEGVETEEISAAEWQQMFLLEIGRKTQPNFRRVINGTGVVIHTNLGRSLLSKKAADALVQAGAYYSNLEFDLATGRRGSRYSHVEKIICDLTGAEAALVVNNNAAAVLLVLDTLAHGTQVIVSRGQLVEIGGSFRIPEVMAKSGARLVEVGATNRTHLYDYERAITPETSLLLRVHTSNFRIIGFTSEVSAADMVDLAHRHGLLVMEDLGSGSLIDLSQFGLSREPTVQDIVREGVDVITFSGDKLLGGPQAGIIVGRKEVIDRVKKNPLNRALRIDKFTLSSLEMILRDYYDTDQALKSIPTLNMLTLSPATIKRRAQMLIRRVGRKIERQCGLSLRATVSRVGGGAMPEFSIPSWAVALEPFEIGVSSLEKEFRSLPVPLIGRIEEERFLIDMRTVQLQEIAMVGDILVDFFLKGMAA
jgi:L-seryl-tRNA(Ser) seleniumtransferase